MAAGGTDQHKDSTSTGLGILLALVGAWVDMTLVRCILAVAAATFLLWPPLHRRFGMSPPATLMLVSVAGLLIGAMWYIGQIYNVGSFLAPEPVAYKFGFSVGGLNFERGFPDDPNGSKLLITGSIDNEGTPSIAKNWKLEIQSADRPKIQGHLLPIYDDSKIAVGTGAWNGTAADLCR